MDAKDSGPTEVLMAGVKLLQSFMNSYGFVYTPTHSGIGSGGKFASGEFRRENRRLELHFRHSLGLVTYHVGSVSISHDEYMWSVLGRRWASKYPGFSDDPLDGFRSLLVDLEQHGTDFLAGSESDFLKRVEHFRELKRHAPRLP